MSAHVLFIGPERGKGQAVLHALQYSGLRLRSYRTPLQPSMRPYATITMPGSCPACCRPQMFIRARC
jgi:hypothetical protein